MVIHNMWHSPTRVYSAAAQNALYISLTAFFSSFQLEEGFSALLHKIFNLLHSTQLLFASYFAKLKENSFPKNEEGQFFAASIANHHLR